MTWNAGTGVSLIGPWYSVNRAGSLPRETIRGLLTALEQVAGFSATADSLTLTDEQGEALVRYEARQPTALQGTTWEALAYNSGKQALVSLEASSSITAEFGDDGSLTGEASVNSDGAGDTTSRETKSIDVAIVTTKMAGPEKLMRQEAAYLAALPQTATWSTEGDEHWLRDADGAALEHDVAAPDDARTGGPGAAGRIRGRGQERRVVRVFDRGRSGAFRRAYTDVDTRRVRRAAAQPARLAEGGGDGRRPARVVHAQGRAPRAHTHGGLHRGHAVRRAVRCVRHHRPVDGRRGRRDGGWLAGGNGDLEWALALLPFAGIFFLWFIGVSRQRLGRWDDRFISSVILGSGVVFLAMVFAAGGLAGALLGMYAKDPSGFPGSDTYSFVQFAVAKIFGVYALRMASVFLICQATAWLRHGLMPRWLALPSYAVALVLLFVGLRRPGRC